MRSLARLGVDVREKTTVTRIEEGRVWLGDEMIEAGTILWTAGVSASPLGATLGVPRDRAGRVLVEPDLSVPGHPEAFVIGDMAGLVDASGKQYPGVSQVAMQQAAHAARMIGRTLERQPARAGSTTRIWATWPPSAATPPSRISAGCASPAFPAWLLWLFIHIVWLIGFRNRLTVLVQWAAAYLTYQRSVRLITRTDGK